MKRRLALAAALILPTIAASAAAPDSWDCVHEATDTHFEMSMRNPYKVDFCQSPLELTGIVANLTARYQGVLYVGSTQRMSTTCRGEETSASLFGTASAGSSEVVVSLKGSWAQLKGEAIVGDTVLPGTVCTLRE